MNIFTIIIGLAVIFLTPFFICGLIALSPLFGPWKNTWLSCTAAWLVSLLVIGYGTVEAVQADGLWWGMILYGLAGGILFFYVLPHPIASAHRKGLFLGVAGYMVFSFVQQPPLQALPIWILFLAFLDMFITILLIAVVELLKATIVLLYTLFAKPGELGSVFSSYMGRWAGFISEMTEEKSAVPGPLRVLWRYVYVYFQAISRANTFDKAAFDRQMNEILKAQRTGYYHGGHGD